MPEPIRVQVKIDHKNYNLVSNEPEEYLHKVAELVNEKIAEIEGRNQFISTDIKMVLTALNLAEDTIKEQRETAALRQKLKDLQVQMDEMEVELVCLREEAQQKQEKKVDGAEKNMHPKDRGNR